MWMELPVEECESCELTIGFFEGERLFTLSKLFRAASTTILMQDIIVFRVEISVTLIAVSSLLLLICYSIAAWVNSIICKPTLFTKIETECEIKLFNQNTTYGPSLFSVKSDVVQIHPSPMKCHLNQQNKEGISKLHSCLLLMLSKILYFLVFSPLWI